MGIYIPFFYIRVRVLCTNKEEQTNVVYSAGINLCYHLYLPPLQAASGESQKYMLQAKTG